jgi:hypothetical protein
MMRTEIRGRQRHSPRHFASFHAAKWMISPPACDICACAVDPAAHNNAMHHRAAII